jgi:hypothetical protein
LRKKLPMWTSSLLAMKESRRIRRATRARVSFEVEADEQAWIKEMERLAAQTGPTIESVLEEVLNESERAAGHRANPA